MKEICCKCIERKNWLRSNEFVSIIIYNIMFVGTNFKVNELIKLN